MYIDYLQTFSQNQAVTATGDSENYTRVGTGDVGSSEAISLFVQPRDYTGTGSVSVSIRTSGEADGNGLVSPLVVASLNIANDKLLDGKPVAVRLPHNMREYMDIRYTVNGNIANGTMTAALVMDVQADSSSLPPLGEASI